MTKLSLDIGYSSVKVEYNGKLYKFATNISFASDSNIEFGSNNFYEFEGESYYVGENAASEAFTTTDYKFLFKFAPLIVYYVFKQLNITEEIELCTGLALVDWKNKDEFTQRIGVISVNNETINIPQINLTPQGAGAYNYYIVYENNGEVPDTICIIDIGYNTINFLYFVEGEPQQNACRSLPGHGVVTLIKSLTNFIETEYCINFSEQEINKIFLKRKFIHNGEEQPRVQEKIDELIHKFIHKLVNSVLVSEKKYIQTSEIVYITGGGSYYLKDTENPSNIKFSKENLEFANVIGYKI